MQGLVLVQMLVNFFSNDLEINKKESLLLKSDTKTGTMTNNNEHRTVGQSDLDCLVNLAPFIQNAF